MTNLTETIAGDFSRCWKQLFLTDVVYKAIAFVVLAPLLAILFRVLVSLSGSAVLTDQDILFFFLGPVGWICILLASALWLGIIALEMAALFAILVTTQVRGKPITVGRALWFAWSKAWPVIQVTTRMVGWTLLTVLPVLAVAAAIYFLLLTDYDINYYLKVKPPVFYAALFAAVILVGVLVIVLMRLFTGWFFALPLVLLEDIRPSRALSESWERTYSHRRTLLLWILGWFFLTALLSALLSWIVVELGRQFVPLTAGSLTMLTIAIGGTLLVWALVNLVVNLLSTTTFATIVVNLFRVYGSSGAFDIERLNLDQTTVEKEGFQYSRRRILAAGILGIAVAVAIGVLAVHTVRFEDNIAIMAHRGASYDAPENTLAAIRKAMKDGADWVEIDVQETADGEVVVFHDADFMKLAGVDLKIWDATMNDIEKIDIGSWLAPEFNDQRVPTLGQVLDLCKGQVNVNIELKYYGHDQQLEQRVVDIVEANDMASNVVFMSLKIDAVRKMKSLRPDWTVGLLMSVSAGNLRQIEADFLAVNANFSDRQFVRAAHAINKQVYVWTVNDPVGMSTMIGRGVDGLITDKPALARWVLGQRAEMGAAQRLLLELAETFGVPTNFGIQ